MNKSNVIPMRLDGLDATDLSRMLERNHARAKAREGQRRELKRVRITGAVTALVSFGSLAALLAW